MECDTPVIIIHSLAQAVAAAKAAAAANRPVLLASAEGAGIYAGPAWFRAVVEATREAVPEARFAALLDCSDEPGAALGAIRSGVERVLFTGRADVAKRLASLARKQGVELVRERPPPDLDLAELVFASSEAALRRCAEILA